MTEREKLLETLKVAYEPRKIPQEDGSVAIYYPTDEDVADMIWAAIIDEYKHRAEVAERALRKAVSVLDAEYRAFGVNKENKTEQRIKNFIAQAEKEIAEEIEE